jgi:hypothetical protein
MVVKLVAVVVVVAVVVLLLLLPLLTSAPAVSLDLSSPIGLIDTDAEDDCLNGTSITLLLLVSVLLLQITNYKFVIYESFSHKIKQDG